ncbi:anhydro-N-acetylmuramic acid kinase [Psychrobacter pygoscelis]|uniref:anhydro-N-acetylmuramic acid kinase n=1 Tax=Psychrobacter pygoscelis TaxID=2488563 RepID=UPI00103C2B6E|nr:anhydro-N-acetylmuramic acid kinase [Psychrobacter pygoscelis]
MPTPTPSSTLDTEPNDITDLADALSETLFDSFDNGYYIGMMSGTSLDGLDAVICQFEHDTDSASTGPTNKIIASHSKDFTPQLRDVLLALCQPNRVDELTGIKVDCEQQPQSELDWFGWASREYAEFASDVVAELLEKSDIDAEAILAIGCHGQTVRHRPQLGFSLQLVDANVIAERTGISVVTDFRRRDMAVGGQGAPLAPAFHLAQFATTSTKGAQSKDRIIVNLGGIANITVLPTGQADKIIGYDTGPANNLLDAWYQHHIAVGTIVSDQTLYDQDGRWAATGTIHQSLLAQLLTHPYFERSAPKSTGREDFHLGWLTAQIAVVEEQNKETIAPKDVQATLIMFTVQSLTRAINHEAQRLALPSGDIIVCGGGAYNTYLLTALDAALPNWQVLTSEALGIAPTWVEAMAFAWLARQSIMGEVGNLPAVTGASKSVVLGQVCFG